MKLIGELKKQVESTATKEEAKDVIANAGMELTEDELDQVTGGYFFVSGNSLPGQHDSERCHCENRYVVRTGYDACGNYYERCGNCHKII